MADNVVQSVGPVTVATEEDAKGAQHQRMVSEFMHGENPVNLSTLVPLPASDVEQTEILRAMLVEMRVQNYMLFQIFATEVEPLELKRNEFASLPVTL